MDLGSYKLPDVEKTTINNEFKLLLSELIRPLNDSRVCAKLKPYTAKTFLKLVERKYGKADTRTLRTLKDKANQFDVFTKGIVYLLKK